MYDPRPTKVPQHFRVCAHVQYAPYRHRLPPPPQPTLPPAAAATAEILSQEVPRFIPVVFFFLFRFLFSFPFNVNSGSLRGNIRWRRRRFLSSTSAPSLSHSIFFSLPVSLVVFFACHLTRNTKKKKNRNIRKRKTDPPNAKNHRMTE